MRNRLHAFEDGTPEQPDRPPQDAFVALPATGSGLPIGPDAPQNLAAAHECVLPPETQDLQQLTGVARAHIGASLREQGYDRPLTPGAFVMHGMPEVPDHMRQLYEDAFRKAQMDIHEKERKEDGPQGDHRFN
jgi:hypothetical protein